MLSLSQSPFLYAAIPEKSRPARRNSKSRPRLVSRFGGANFTGESEMFAGVFIVDAKMCAKGVSEVFWSGRSGIRLSRLRPLPVSLLFLSSDRIFPAQTFIVTEKYAFQRVKKKQKIISVTDLCVCKYSIQTHAECNSDTLTYKFQSEA